MTATAEADFEEGLSGIATIPGKAATPLGRLVEMSGALTRPDDIYGVETHPLGTFIDESASLDSGGAPAAFKTDTGFHVFPGGIAVPRPTGPVTAGEAVDHSGIPVTELRSPSNVRGPSSVHECRRPLRHMR